VSHAINDRVIALPIAALADIPKVILASGGLNKAPVIAAALRAGLVDVLISDEVTVVAALEIFRTSA
jgi:DNA-binding transcriptional regulator LsrR (DeoR family)